MATVPEGCGPRCRDAALRVTHVERPHHAPRVLPRNTWDRNAAMNDHERGSTLERVARPFIGMLNRQIRAKTPAREICRELDGQVVALRVRDTSLSVYFQVGPEELELVPAIDEPDLVITGSVLAFGAMAAGSGEAEIRQRQGRACGACRNGATIPSPDGLREAGPRGGAVRDRWRRCRPRHRRYRSKYRSMGPRRERNGKTKHHRVSAGRESRSTEPL